MNTHFCAAAVLALSVSAVHAQTVLPFQVDHFKCYLPSEATPVPPAPVRLLDQFGPSMTVVGNIFRLCNPTRKFHNGQVTPIRTPDNHLTLHQTSPEPVVHRRVKIRNQFGEQQLITHDARILAVPTQKKPHGPPAGLSHFSCYAAEGQPVAAPVALQDQFFASKHRIGRPLLFCNPVQKGHNGVITPIANPNDHLTCYGMTRVAYSRAVEIRNQFGEFKLETSYADMACVPTQKLAWEVID
jgi:hypothetical protein